MYRILKVIFIVMIIAFSFSGCSAKINPKILALNENTVQNIKEKDINIEIVDVKLSGEVPTNKYLDIFIIEEEDIKKSLLLNIDKFYSNNINNRNIYKINLIMDFKSKNFIGDADVDVNAIYTISNGHEDIAIMKINSNYIAKFNLTFKTTVGITLKYMATGTISNGTQNNEDLKYENLEQISYAEDNTVPLTSIVGAERLRIAYGGAIRLNFAKFLQKFNEFINDKSNN